MDRLGFPPYVSAVAGFLFHRDTSPPLTLSVEGEWGSGKSSFMMQLRELIERTGGKIVWFNAWRYDKSEELWAAFALDLISQLAGTLPLFKRWLLHVKLSRLRFDWRRGWIQVLKFLALTSVFLLVTIRLVRSPLQDFSSIAGLLASNGSSELLPMKVLLALGGGAAYLLIFLAILKKLAELIGNPMQVQLARYLRDPKYEARTTFIDVFQADFKQLVKVYSGGERMFVFIDDLDRCEVPKAAELMHAINMMISESVPVFYILGLDREKIAAGLAAKYERLLPYLSRDGMLDDARSVVGRDFGYAFLEKFIQIPFLVPKARDRDLDRLLYAPGEKSGEGGASGEAAGPAVDPGLLVEVSSDSASVLRVVRMVAPALDYNPRRLKQFVNLFRLRALLAGQTGLFGPPRDGKRFTTLTFDQLGKLVAIMLRWPLLLTELEADPVLLAKLQQRAWGAKPADSKSLAYWSSKSDLMKLIAYAGNSQDPLNDGLAQQQYSLEKVDVQRFLEVSPLVPAGPRGRTAYSQRSGADAPSEGTGSAPGDDGESSDSPDRPMRSKRRLMKKK